MSDYSLETYRAILERARRAGYEFVPFRSEGLRAAGELCLRHDVDFSLEMALEVARANSAQGVAATFFVLSRSPIYNLASHRSLALVRAIRALGQHVALHATVPPEPLSEDELVRLLRADWEAAARIVSELAPVFSWHNPTPELLDGWRERSTVAGLTNAYAAPFTKAIEYLSDSNRRHPADHFLDRVGAAARPSLQLLLHPENWVAGGSSMRETLEGIWRAVLKAQEEGLGENRTHREAFPSGLPAGVVDAFVGAWRRAAERADRVLLDAVREDDLPRLFEWINERGLVVQNAAYKPVSEAQHRAWFDGLKGRRDVALFAIRVGPVLIGTCQLHTIDPVHRSAELQIRIGDPAHQGQGHGTEAVARLLDFAFQDLNLNRVYLHVFADNARARRVYEKAGFRTEGVLRAAAHIDGRYVDVLVMGVLRADRVV